MKYKHVLYYILTVLVIAFIGQAFYYFVWMLTDEEFMSSAPAGWPFGSWTTLIDYIASCIVTTIATVFYWRSRERIERERALLRLQVLDNQLSPHFVFNNFSILAELIEVNPQKASAYLMNLSKVYRYVLSHQEHQTVKLQDELQFTKLYIQLLNERFGEGFSTVFGSELDNMKGLVPPCVLQLLIENAIKHNEHTQQNPLMINVTSRDKSICVSNKKRPIASFDSANVGQHNIEERYRILTRKSVVIQETEDEYIVILPIIEES